MTNYVCKLTHGLQMLHLSVPAHCPIGRSRHLATSSLDPIEVVVPLDDHYQVWRH
jgi:hypothetical protein